MKKLQSIPYNAHPVLFLVFKILINNIYTHKHSQNIFISKERSSFENLLEHVSSYLTITTYIYSKIL